MHLDRMKTLSFIFVVGLSFAFGCSSKNTSGDDAATGGASYVATGGGANGGDGNGGDTSAGVDETYCNGLLVGKNCGQSSAKADLRTVNMMLVVDQSGSMTKNASAESTQSKWADMNGALDKALKAVAKDINFGLILYPYSGDPTSPGVDPETKDAQESCNVPNGDNPDVAVASGIAPGIDHVTEILGIVKNSKPAGGTPTAMALEQALKYYTEGEGKGLTGSKWVLLATDGGPNCNFNNQCGIETCTQNIDCQCGEGCGTSFNCCEANSGSEYGYICLDADAVVTQIDKLSQAGIKTFVVGVPGTEAYTATLDRMAEAGKMTNQNPTAGEKFYAVSAANSLQSLQDTFSTITTQLVRSCDIELKASPPDKKNVIVAVDCDQLPLVDQDTPEDSTDVSGFWIDYTTNPAHLRITGGYCNRIKNVGVEAVDVITGCQGVY